MLKYTSVIGGLLFLGENKHHWGRAHMLNVGLSSIVLVRLWNMYMYISIDHTGDRM